MIKPQGSLLANRRFFPIFAVQFLGAFNDNVFRFALLTLITYRLSEQLGYSAPMLNMIAAGLFILPFFLFSATGGVLADKFDKKWLVQYIKLSEVIIMLLGSIALINSYIWLLLITLSLTGIQSALFGPVKYSILPSLLSKDQLIHGNALVEAGTFLSILVGTMTGSLLILGTSGSWTVSAVLLSAALLGFLASLYLPSIPSVNKNLPVRMNILKETAHVIRIGADRTEIRRVIFGVSWFWFFGFVLQSQMTPLAKEILYSSERVFALFLLVFTLGIAIGSLICHRVLRQSISAHLVPFAGVVISVFCVDLYFALGQAIPQQEGELYTLSGFLLQPPHWRILIDMAVVSIAAGFYIVPLYTLMQSRSDNMLRSRVIAANNISNAAFMVVATLFVILVFLLGFHIQDLFWMLAILNGLVAIMIFKIVAKKTMRTLGKILFKVLFRVDVKGLENFPVDNEPCIIVANHTSYLDGPLLMCLLPGMPVFAINTNVNKLWWAQLFTQFFDVCPIDPANPIALRQLVKTLRSGRNVMIFPEGRITVTGGLMKLYEGPGRIADLTNSRIIPVHIHGAHASHFSKMQGLIPLRWFPRIRISIYPPEKIRISNELKGKARRGKLKIGMYDIMTTLIYRSAPTDSTLYDKLLSASNEYGSKSILLEDAQQNTLNYKKLIIGSQLLAKKVKKQLGPNPNIGILLPNTAAAAVSFFALQFLSKVPAMINFSSGTENVNTALKAAEIKTVITSRTFIDAGKLHALIDSMQDKVRLLYLEDVRERISSVDKLSTAVIVSMRTLFPQNSDPSHALHPALILFTSGSEGTPKGVVLSHKNILSNHAQIKACIDFNSRDRFFNALPMFHSFGISVGTLLPLLSGIYCYLYPSPLHYKLVPEMAYEKQATVIAGTDSFLNGYAKYADGEDFQTIRYAIAGAEKLKESTKNIWYAKFGIRIHEGYGVTETAPALSINTYSQFKDGSVGRLLPGVSHRLVNVEGVDGGRLHIAGDNVMLGYMKVDQPGVLQPLESGWHDTGDIVDVDESGFISILGRAKRFAKIGGEMISLTQVEGFITSQWPDQHHCVCAITDERKGERLVLITENSEITRKQLIDIITVKGGTELMAPRKIIHTDTLPLLGSGKMDYGAIQKLAESN